MKLNELRQAVQIFQIYAPDSDVLISNEEICIDPTKKILLAHLYNLYQLGWRQTDYQHFEFLVEEDAVIEDLINSYTETKGWYRYT